MYKQKQGKVAKFEKEFPEFVSEVHSLSADQLNARLAQLAKDAEANDDAKNDDEGLSSAREQVKEFSAPYRDLKKTLKAKSRYIIGLMKG